MSGAPARALVGIDKPAMRPRDSDVTLYAGLTGHNLCSARTEAAPDVGVGVLSMPTTACGGEMIPLVLGTGACGIATPGADRGRALHFCAVVGIDDRGMQSGCRVPGNDWVDRGGAAPKLSASDRLVEWRSESPF